MNKRLERGERPLFPKRAVVTGGINALESEIENIKIINEENTLGVEVINSNDKIQLILKTILIQLETIESSYKKYIKIRK